VDELPAPADVEYSFGSYHNKTLAEGNVLRYTRTFEIKVERSARPSRRLEKILSHHCQ
jgi:hypothetical protein